MKTTNEIKEHVELGRSRMPGHISGKFNPVDPLTKEANMCTQSIPEWEQLIGGSWTPLRGDPQCPDLPDPHYGVVAKRPSRKVRARTNTRRG